MLESRMAFETALKAVNGGHTTISTSLIFASSRLRSATRSSASATVLFIFQLPAMISLRCLSMLGESLLFVGECGHAGKDCAFQKFEAGAAAGAHKSHAITQAGDIQRLH